MATAASSMLPSQFDDRHIQWRALGDFPHLVAAIFFVDEEQNIIDFVIKFDPNEHSNPRLRLKARKQGVGVREFLRFATL